MKPEREELSDDDLGVEHLRVATQARDDWRARPLYDGRELRPFEGRPGALDFLAKPSRGLQ